MDPDYNYSFIDLFTLAAHYIETKEIAPTPDVSMRVCLFMKSI